MHRLSILIVDDDPDLAASLADFLALDGHEVHVELAGEAGINSAVQHDYDLTLMDIVLPDINGFDCLAEIRKIKPGAPVVLMTGFSANHLDQEAADQGDIEVLRKPIDLQALSRRLKAI
jgi:DNA-binding response OmpR family regulator